MVVQPLEYLCVGVCAECDKFFWTTHACRQAFWMSTIPQMKVVLMRKLAERMDGIDVRDHRVGDVLNLPGAEAHLMVAEHWAIPERRVEHGQAPDAERRRTTDPARPYSRDNLDRDAF